MEAGHCAPIQLINWRLDAPMDKFFKSGKLNNQNHEQYHLQRRPGG